MPDESAKPRVSVVIPCYNDGRYVVEAVQSASAQEPCEIVVVDDGSDDPHTLEVLSALSADSVRVISQANSGLSAARMAGVHATVARYVFPLDADDRLLPGALAVLADVLDGRPEVGAAWGDLESFGARQCLYPTLPDLDPWRLTYLSEVPVSTLLRRSALLSVGGWDMGSGYEDWDLFMKLAERGWTGARVSRTTLHYREHAQGRMYVESRARHDELCARLRERHPALFRSRRRHRAESAAPWQVKAAWPLIDRLPLVSELDKEGLFILARDAWEPEMASSCTPGVARRIGRKLRERLAPRGDSG